MSKRYTTEQKADVLTRLSQNKYNTALTAAQTGIPVRTLRTWWHNARMASQIAVLTTPNEHSGAAPTKEIADGAAPSSLGPPHPPPIEQGSPHFQNDLAALAYLREQLLDELLSSPQDWRGSLALMSPYQRSQIAIMLLDRLMKLDEHLKPYRPKPPTIVKVNDSEGEEPNGRKRDFAESPSRTEENPKL